MEPELPLRDIHLPEPVGWWPPAPGWWLLLVGVPVLLALLVWLWRLLRRKTPKKLALRELEAIAASDAEAREKIRQLAILLRRTALSVYPREAVASLVGTEWLAFLDAPMPGKGFSEGVGRLLVDAPYRRDVQDDLAPLFALCREWIKRLPKPGKAKAAKASAKAAKADAPLPPQPTTGEAPDPRRFAKPAANDGESQ